MLNYHNDPLLAACFSQGCCRAIVLLCRRDPAGTQCAEPVLDALHQVQPPRYRGCAGTDNLRGATHAPEF